MWQMTDLLLSLLNGPAVLLLVPCCLVPNKVQIHLLYFHCKFHNQPLFKAYVTPSRCPWHLETTSSHQDAPHYWVSLDCLCFLFRNEFCHPCFSFPKALLGMSCFILDIIFFLTSKILTPKGLDKIENMYPTILAHIRNNKNCLDSNMSPSLSFLNSTGHALTGGLLFPQLSVWRSWHMWSRSPGRL